MRAQFLCLPLRKRRANWRNKGNCHGRIHLYYVRHPIRSDLRTACRLPDLRGGASIRSSGGQDWTTLKRLERSHMPTFRDEAGLTGIGIAPAFGINQRALLVPSNDGNVLWDCISLVSDVMVELIKGVGGLKAIAISHPHYYTTMVDWSRAFGGIPVYLNAADQDFDHAPRPLARIVVWRDEGNRAGHDAASYRGPL